MPTKNPVSIYQLKVTLKHSKPPIWRRIQVKSDTTLSKFHHILQIAMGWTNSHLHQFIADGVYYGEPDPDYGFEMVNEKRTRLNQIVRGVKDTCVYEYDFGDGWDHEIVLEKVLAPEAKTRYPCCIKGKRHCPPEDVGGVWGYSNFLEALQQKEHPEHEEYLEWIGDSFDPAAFALEDVNQELQQIR